VTIDREELDRLARESGAMLAELGVRPGDAHWLTAQAETIASLRGETRRRSLFGYLLRAARRAARTAR
jgi:hypothetical protein